MMRVVLYEPDPAGHRFAYLAHVVPALADLPCEPILLTTPSAAASPEFALHLRPHAGRMRVNTSVTVVAKPRTLGRLWKQWADMVRAIHRLQPAHLYVAYGDGLVQVAGLERLLGRRPWPDSMGAEVLLLRGGFTRGASSISSRLREKFSPSLIRLGPWDRIHHLIPDHLEALRRAGGDMQQRCGLMPDPVEPAAQVTKTDARRELGIPADGRYIGCAGMIDARKGIDRFLAAFQLGEPNLHQDDRVLLAGPVAPEIRSLLEHELNDDVQRKRVVLVDRPLSEAEMNLAVAALDVVCTPYPTHIHSASIVIRAAAAERPVLGSAIGWIEQTIRRFGLGGVCNVEDHEGFARAIVASLSAAEHHVPTEASRRFAAFHSGRNFAAHWTAHIRERLGLPPEERIEWSWVTTAEPNDARC
jgi:glycosyltransferase involved in cell wall biosynthesis